ncbi:unnamed protein product [Rhodiola kirilowii]
MTSPTPYQLMLSQRPHMASTFTTSNAIHLYRLFPIPDSTTKSPFHCSKLSATLTTPRKHVSSSTAEFQSSTKTSSRRLETKRVVKSPVRETQGNPAARDEEDISKKMMEVSDDSRSKYNSFGDRGRKYKMAVALGSKKMRNEVKKGDGAKACILAKKSIEKTAAELREIEFRVALDSCSKRGDVMCGIELYDQATKEGLKLNQYHFSVLLYLCSSAASGIVRPAKSGTSSRTLGLNAISSSDNDASSVFTTGKRGSDSVGNLDEAKMQVHDENVILVSNEVKKYAVDRGYEIYRRMCKENVEMNEASFTAMARIAMSMGNGDLAFDVVKQMIRLGIVPKLRSYGPALSAFCTSGKLEKAFEVERHMVEQGINPEEPELEVLLRASIEAGNGDKIYYLLHKLRTLVRRVSNTNADLIRKWFESEDAAHVGKSKWNRMRLKAATESGGGGWHGQGWLGKGQWAVSIATVGDDGFCRCCGERLALIDLDPLETEKFAESVASIAMKREKHSNFQKFQEWLDYYGPFEAVVDAANVGLYSQHRFMPTKISAVVNGIRQMLPSKKWPLIVLHNRRVTGNKMDEEVNKALVEKWKNADALYPTPTGSNDDWYWLYAAIKFKCLLVTNDEMRDHTFQLLGNDFFPKWKERHQVHFSFNEMGPVFHMPPPCSVVIQESEHGGWHIPIESEVNTEEDRTWLCITRAKSGLVADVKGSEASSNKKRRSKTTVNNEQPSQCGENQVVKRGKPEEMYRKLMNIVSGSEPRKHRTILSELQKAEEISSCMIDFQI